ncbi:MAG: acetate uptake transporter [Caldisphaera sp.]|jgi:succinate-acetate transporter protein|nr:MAG: hypothetical protein C0201_00235 [Caldisphaera sp.]PMP89487.1 MAG: hypothetical protein C0171_07145 [Caldisphaera sp.]
MSKEEIWANPAALGLVGFGLTTIVLSAANAGLVPTTGLTLGYAISWGGLAQVFAGWISFRRNDMFGGIAFSGYGLFWIGLALALILGLPTSGKEVGLWMFLWGIFTLYMDFGSIFLKARVLSIVLTLLFITFFTLAAADWSASTVVMHIAGVIGIVTGISAVYLSMAIVLNGTKGKVLLPE